jgi:hypothetical protein
MTFIYRTYKYIVVKLTEATGKGKVFGTNQNKNHTDFLIRLFLHACNTFLLQLMQESRCSSVQLLGYGLDHRGSITGKNGVFFFATSSRLSLGSNQPPIQWIPGSFPGGKVAEA